MADEGAKEVKAAGKVIDEPPAGAEQTAATWAPGPADRLHRRRGLDRPAQEGQAGGGDLLRLLRRDGNDLDRPVTFVFNGGPGASSAFLHMGAVGPARVALPRRRLAAAHAAGLVPNE